MKNIFEVLDEFELAENKKDRMSVIERLSDIRRMSVIGRTPYFLDGHYAVIYIRFSI